VTRYAAGAFLLWLLASVPFLADAAGQEQLIPVATRIMIFAAAAIGLAFIMGGGGLVSLGHAAALGIGTYVTVVAHRGGIAELTFLLPAAAAAGGLFGLVVGLIALRTAPLRFLMITLLATELLRLGVSELAPLGGSTGLLLPQRSLLFGMAIAATPLGLFWLAFGWLVGTYIFFEVLTRTRFGRALRALRQNYAGMERFGASRFRLQLKAVVISGALGGSAGVLLANLLDAAHPATFEWQQSAELVLIAIVGGAGMLAGPIAGAAGLIGFEEYLARDTVLWRSAIGLLAIAVGVIAAGAFDRKGASLRG
jgi:branched-chain amino acid transport system permease protein